MIEASDVLAITQALEDAGLLYWLDGGWGVDALVGEQTRPHEDLDLVIELRVSDRAIEALSIMSFNLTEDERPTRFVMRDAEDRSVDFHTVTFHDGGGGIQVLQDRLTYRYASEGFLGAGVVAKRRLRCLTAEAQVACHLGYEPDANDFHDVRLLNERFGLEIPPPFS